MQERIARAQLKALKSSGGGSSRRERTPIKTLAERQMEQAAVMAAGAQARGATAQAGRLQDERDARKAYIGMQARTANPLGFGKYSLENALKQFSGGPAGRSEFFGLGVDTPGATGGPSSARSFALARQLQQAQLPNYGMATGDPVNTPGNLYTARHPYLTGDQDLTYDPNAYRMSYTAPTPYKKGSLPGTISAPPGGKVVRVHDKEAIISADQADEPLMAYLMADKLRKMQTGQMDGKGTGPGRKKMPSYQMGSMGFATSDVDPRLAAALGLDILPPVGRAPAPPPPAPVAPSGPNLGMLTPGGGLFGRPPRESGELLRESLGGIFGPVVGGASEFAGGLFGTEPVAPEAEAPTVTPPTGMVPDIAAPPPPSLVDRMLADAEEGRKEASGGGESTYESETRKGEVNKLRKQADRMYGWLTNAVQRGDITPDLYKSMTDQAKRFDSLADTLEQRAERKETARTAQKEMAEERVQRAYATGVEAEMGAEAAIKRQQEQYNQMRQKYDTAEQEYISASDDGDEKKAANALGKMVQTYRESRALATGEMVSWQEAQVEVMLDAGLITEEQAIDMYGQLAR